MTRTRSQFSVNFWAFYLFLVRCFCYDRKYLRGIFQRDREGVSMDIMNKIYYIKLVVYNFIVSHVEHYEVMGNLILV